MRTLPINAIAIATDIRITLLATICHNCEALSIVLKKTMLPQVSYLHYKMPIYLDLLNYPEATNDDEIRKILKYLHLLLSSVTVKTESYNQTLTYASGS
jgi:hypothetical protein